MYNEGPYSLHSQLHTVKYNGWDQSVQVFTANITLNQA